MSVSASKWEEIELVKEIQNKVSEYGCPIIFYYLSTNAMKMFCDNKIQIPYKLLMHVKKTKEIFLQINTNKVLNNRIKFLDDKMNDDKEVKEDIKKLYNQYRREDKYLGGEAANIIQVICDGGDNGDSIDEDLRDFISEKHDAPCFTYHKQEKKLIWVDKKYMTPEFKRFKKMIKKNKIVIHEENNLTLTMNGKSKWYSLVFSPPEGSDFQIDLAGLKIFEIMVEGYGYYFQKKRNRDAMYEWLIK